MTRAELLMRLEQLTEEDVQRIAPYLEADLDAISDLESFHREIEAGRRSRDEGPLIESAEALARARNAIRK